MTFSVIKTAINMGPDQKHSHFREMKRELAPLFSRSLTLVPRSFLLNRTETLATQAKIRLECASVNRSNVLLMSKACFPAKKMK